MIVKCRVGTRPGDGSVPSQQVFTSLAVPPGTLLAPFAYKLYLSITTTEMIGQSSKSPLMSRHPPRRAVFIYQAGAPGNVTEALGACRVKERQRRFFSFHGFTRSLVAFAAIIRHYLKVQSNNKGIQHKSCDLSIN